MKQIETTQPGIIEAFIEYLDMIFYKGYAELLRTNHPEYYRAELKQFQQLHFAHN